MKKVMVVLEIVMILIGLTGCGKREKGYVGTYVKDTYYYTSVLEIKPDDTFIISVEQKYGPRSIATNTSEGRWKITKGKIVLEAMTTMLPSTTTQGELKGNELKLIGLGGMLGEDVYIKQN